MVFVPFAEHWMISLPSWGNLRVHGTSSNQCTCGLIDFDRVPLSILWEVLLKYGVSDYEPFGPYTTVVRVYVILASGGCWSTPCGCPLSLILLMIFMDKISRCNQVADGFHLGGLRILSLLFVDNVVLFLWEINKCIGAVAAVMKRGGDVFNSLSTSLLSPMVTSSGLWPKEQDHGWKWQKLAFSEWWLLSLLEIGWGVQPPGSGLE